MTLLFELRVAVKQTWQFNYTATTLPQVATSAKLYLELLSSATFYAEGHMQEFYYSKHRFIIVTLKLGYTNPLFYLKTERGDFNKFKNNFF